MWKESPNWKKIGWPSSSRFPFKLRQEFGRDFALFSPQKTPQKNHKQIPGFDLPSMSRILETGLVDIFWGLKRHTFYSLGTFVFVYFQYSCFLFFFNHGTSFKISDRNHIESCWTFHLLFRKQRNQVRVPSFRPRNPCRTYKVDCLAIISRGPFHLYGCFRK